MRNEQISTIRQAFETDCVLLKCRSILPTKTIKSEVRASRKYQQIVASVKEFGLIEPPVVARHPTERGTFMLLDGHLRIDALIAAGCEEIECLVSTDDEAVTYNRNISRLAAIQEHRMIVNALDRGVSEDKLARALMLNVNSIRRKVRMLDGVCNEAIQLLSDRDCSMAVFEVLKKMRPMRQIETCELMNNANNYSVGYAAAILSITPQAQLVEPSRRRAPKGLTPEALARITAELGRLQESMALVQHSYGANHLQLTLLKKYLARMLASERIVSYLQTYHPGILSEFRSISGLSSVLEEAA